MSGDKPTYNPDEFNEDTNQTEEERVATAKKREELMAKLTAKTREKKEAAPKPKLGTPKETIRSGLKVHHDGRVLPSGGVDKRDKSEIQEDREAAMESLKNKIRGVLKNYKVNNIFKPKLTVSDTDRDKYIFKLLENYKTIFEFEDKTENIVSRLEEYLKNRPV